MSVRYDWRDLATAADHGAHDAAVVREVARLHALGRTCDDIGTLLGMNPADVHALIFGTDAEGTT